MVAEVSPDLVMQSSVVAALWESGSVWGRAQALKVVEAAGAWEDERTTTLLDGLGPDDKETMERTAHALSEHVVARTEAAPFALGWFAKWIPTCASDPVRRGVFEIERSLHAVIQAAPEAALDAAEALLDAHLSAGDVAEVQHGIEYPMPIPPGADSPSAQVCRLLADRLTEPQSRAQALAVLDRLVASEDATRRLVAMDAMKDSIGVCRRVIVKAVENHANHVWPHSRWVDHFLNHVFPHLTPGDRRRVRAALVALPDESEREGSKGAIKWYALAAVPERYRSTEIKAAMLRLREANPQLSEPSRERRAPGQRIEFRSVPEEPLGWDWAEVIAEPGALLSRIAGIGVDHWPDAYSVGRQLGQALAKTPDRIPAVLGAIAHADPPVSRELVGSAASSLGQAETIDGKTLLLLARALEPIATTETRQALSGALAQRWQALSKRGQAETARLLCQWARPETEPDPVDPECARDREDPVNVGLNSGRGGIAVSMLDVLPFATGRTEAALRTAILRLAADPAVCVRAVVLAWLGNIVRAADRRWLVACAKLCVSGFPPAVLAEAHRVLRGLGPTDISEFGLSLVRVMLGSGDKAAQAGGFLAAFWYLWSGAEGPDGIVEDIIAGDCTPAKEEAARVFAVNLVADDDGARAKAAAAAEQLLQDKNAEVRRAVVAHLPPAEHADLSRAMATVELAAGDTDQEVLGRLWMQVYADQPEVDRQNVALVAVVIRRILDNDTEAVRRDFLTRHDYHLVSVYRLLKDSGGGDLALRLLDAACFHRLAQAGPLLDELDPVALQGPDSA